MESSHLRALARAGWGAASRGADRLLLGRLQLLMIIADNYHYECYGNNHRIIFVISISIIIIIIISSSSSSMIMIMIMIVIMIMIMTMVMIMITTIIIIIIIIMISSSSSSSSSSSGSMIISVFITIVIIEAACSVREPPAAGPERPSRAQKHCGSSVFKRAEGTAD